MNEEKLIKLAERAARGDKKAFSHLCEMKARDILYITTRMMKNAQDGEDAAQEVLIRMQKYIQDLRHPEAFNAWLYRIINGVCMNMLKKNSRDPYTETAASKSFEGDADKDPLENIPEDREEFLPYDFVEAKEKQKYLLKALDTLPERYRICIYLYYYEQMSYEEIAQVLDVSTKVVDNALTRGRKALQQELEKDPKVKRFLTKGFAVTPLPVLTQVLRRDAQEIISDEAVQRLLANTTAAGGAALFFYQRLAKILIGTAAVGGLAAAGFLLYGAGEKKEIPVEIQSDSLEEDILSETETASVESIADEWLETDTPIQDETEKSIQTLEDMIGAAEADVLRGYAGQGNIDREEVKAFLLSIGMELYEGVFNPFSQWEYTMYILEKQDKRLLVILMKDMNENKSGMAFRFTDREEELPANIEIMISYKDWKRRG